MERGRVGCFSVIIRRYSARPDSIPLASDYSSPSEETRDLGWTMKRRCQAVLVLRESNGSGTPH